MIFIMKVHALSDAASRLANILLHVQQVHDKIIVGTVSGVDTGKFYIFVTANFSSMKRIWFSYNYFIALKELLSQRIQNTKYAPWVSVSN